MNEETISKVLTGETDIAKMSRDDFVELLKCLGRMYFARVMNCVDGTGRYDKEWTALSSIFNRMAESITEKPSGDCAKLREALDESRRIASDLGGCRLNDYWKLNEIVRVCDAALAAPHRNCDRFGGDIDKLREACARERGLNPEEDFPDVFPDWLLALAQEGGAK